MDQRVLVVDDDPFAIALLGRYLGGYGFEAVKVLSAASALAVLRAPNPPKIVISDWMMPVMDGLDLCRAVRSDPKIPQVYFIILTALSDLGRPDEAREAGADDFLSKPCEYARLLARVRAGQRLIAEQNHPTRC